MEQWEKKKIAAICVIVLTCLGLSMWESMPKKLQESEVKIGSSFVESEKPQGIKVYVSGAVKNPGIYEVDAGVRAVDVIAVAGGMAADANENKVNLAKKCKDGTQVNVPFLTAKQKKEKLQAAGYEESTLISKEFSGNKSQVVVSIIKKVNINTAGQAELESLPGVGTSTANKIINYRTRNKFKAIEDIMQISGIGPSKFNSMKELLEV